jgi:hypothetical protein
MCVVQPDGYDINSQLSVHMESKTYIDNMDGCVTRHEIMVPLRLLRYFTVRYGGLSPM